MNAAGFPILSLITFLPLAGVLFIATLRGDDAAVARNARFAALWTSLVVLGLVIYLWVEFDPAQAGFQFVEADAWFPGLNVAYRMGVDGISLFLIVMTAALSPIAILSSWSITRRAREFAIAFLLTETMTLGMFAATDFVVFYIFFEAVLIPMYLIIGVWGGEKRIYAAVKFFLFTLAGSMLMLVALVWMWSHAGTTDMTVLLHYRDFAAGPDVAVRRVPRLVRREGGGVAAAHLAAGRLWRGAVAGEHHARRRAVENGGLWVSAFRGADVAASLGGGGAADVRARRDGGDLYLLRGRWRRRI